MMYIYIINTYEHHSILYINAICTYLGVHTKINGVRTQLRAAVHRRHENAKEDFWRCGGCRNTKHGDFNQKGCGLTMKT